MKSTELRIGNWVNDVGGIPAQVVKITKGKTLLDTPIPLTKEWLKRFGFEETDTLKYIIDDLWRINIMSDGTYYWGVYGETSNLVELKHVHQLQNLYFALTGNELTSY